MVEAMVVAMVEVVAMAMELESQVLAMAVVEAMVGVLVVAQGLVSLVHSTSPSLHPNPKNRHALKYHHGNSRNRHLQYSRNHRVAKSPKSCQNFQTHML